MFILLVKTKNFNSTTYNKILFFNQFENAYDYGLSVKPQNSKFEKIYSNDNWNEINKNSIVWKLSSGSFPVYECVILSVDSDIILNIYQTHTGEEKIMKYIYEQLYVNDYINN